MILEPLLSTLVIRYDPGHFIPEPIRVIHFLSMAQLMNHNIVQHFPRDQGQQAVEIQISLAAAATPPCMLCAYCNLFVGYSHEGRIVLNCHVSPLSLTIVNHMVPKQQVFQTYIPQI